MTHAVAVNRAHVHVVHAPEATEAPPSSAPGAAESPPSSASGQPTSRRLSEERLTGRALATRYLDIALRVSNISRRTVAAKLGLAPQTVDEWLDDARPAHPGLGDILSKTFPKSVRRAFFAAAQAADDEDVEPAPKLTPLELAAQVSREAGEFIGAVLTLGENAAEADLVVALRELDDVLHRATAARSVLLARISKARGTK